MTKNYNRKSTNPNVLATIELLKLYIYIYIHKRHRHLLNSLQHTELHMQASTESYGAFPSVIAAMVNAESGY